MAASLIIEEESGTYDRTPHAHNGYFAGDFTDEPMLTNTQLAALTALSGKPVRPAWSPTATCYRLRLHPIGNHRLPAPVLAGMTLAVGAGGATRCGVSTTSDAGRQRQ